MLIFLIFIEFSIVNYHEMPKMDIPLAGLSTRA